MVSVVQGGTVHICDCDFKEINIWHCNIVNNKQINKSSYNHHKNININFQNIVITMSENVLKMIKMAIFAWNATLTKLPLVEGWMHKFDFFV